jgi:uncharacterized membrane protein YfcA
MTLAIAIAAGTLIGLSLGALGGGGSILAVPVLIYLLDQSAAQATTGSLVIVGVTALIGALTAHRAGNTRLARGIAFGTVATGGAAVGAKASTLVPDAVLLASFAALMLLVGGLMTIRQLRQLRHTPTYASRPTVDEPIISVRAGLFCNCPRALKIVVTATAVGLVTGFLGVGGGFLIVPALTLALGLRADLAVGTSLVVITVTSAAALAVRAGAGVAPDWSAVAALTAASAAAGGLGARLAAHTHPAKLSAAFTILILAVAVYTATRALPALA